MGVARRGDGGPELAPTSRIGALAILTTALFPLGVLAITYDDGAGVGVFDVVSTIGLLGFLGAFISTLVTWGLHVRSLDGRRRLSTSAVVAGLLLTVISLFAATGGPCPAVATRSTPNSWRGARIAVESGTGTFGVEMPVLVLDSTVQWFCPTALALPHLLGGMALVAAAVVVDNWIRGTP